MMLCNNKILLILSLFIATLSLSAQSPGEIEDKMNEIKLNENLIYGEGLNSDKNLAYSNALNDLLQTVNELREERKQEPVIGSTLQPIAKELHYSANGRHTVLLYIPLSKAYELTVNSHSDITGQSQQTQTPPSQSADVPPTPPVQQPAPQPQPADPPSQPQPVPTVSAPLSDDVIEVLCGQDNWAEIKGFLAQYKDLGQIRETGVARTPAEVPDDAVSILVDELYGILAILSPKTSDPRINYRTNNIDSETNYSNCKVIVWYR